MISRPSLAPDLLRDCSMRDQADWNEAIGRIAARVALPDLACISLEQPDCLALIAARMEEGRKVLALASPARVAQRKAAFAAGVDEFLTTGPIDPAELTARLGLLGQGTALPPDISLDKGNRTVMLAGAAYPLVERETDLLAMLIAAKGRVVTHGELLETVWHGRSDGRHNLRVAVNRLRAKLEPEPDLPRYILAEPAIGYRIGNGGRCALP